MPLATSVPATAPAADASPLTLPFAAIRAGDLPYVGGKGANLGEMASAGFPVPDGFCVTTFAYRAFLEGTDAEAEVYGRLDGLAKDDVEGVRMAGAAVRAHLVALPIPPPVAEAILAAWHAAGTEAAYAVRSSATAEDLPGASFAGQQDTYLNIRGEGALLDAVRRCWVSLFTDRAILYRAQNGFDHRDVALSVVVQHMVQPEVSGILFTADPLTGHRHIASIDAGFGLGEALVSGLITADLYRVDARTGRVLDAKVGDKAFAIRSLPEGGTRHEPLPPEQRTRPSLTPEQAVQIAQLGARVAAHYGQPQDIEWCIDASGQLFIVQARPITSLYPLPEPRPSDDALHLYFSFSHAQVMTDAMSPLGLSIWRTLIPFGKSSDPRSTSRLLTTAGGRLYVDVTPALLFGPLGHRLPRILTVADRLIAAALAEVAVRPEFLAGATKIDVVKPLDVLHFVGPIVARMQVWLWHRPPEWIVPWISARIEAAIKAFQTGLNRAPAGAPRMREAQRLLGTAFLNMVGQVLPVIASGMIGRLLLIRITGNPSEVDGLLRGLPGNITTGMDLAVGDLADLARANPAVAGYLQGLDLQAPDLQTRLAALPTVAGGLLFLEAWADFRARYGMRGSSEIDIGRPRWAEDPRPLLQVILGSLQHDTPGTHRLQHARQMVEGEAAAERLVAAAGHGLLGWPRARVVRRLTRVVRNAMAAREHPKYMLIRMFWLVKRVILDAAAQLVAAGRLDATDDVWLLTLEELATALEQPGEELRPLIDARRLDQARFTHLRPPRVITSDGEVPVVRPDRTGLPEGALVGSPASAGIVEGIARVVMDPNTEVLSPGEILIAPFTDPGWTPLFINAAGLVMEVGGLMTHGSVVAREYGIPAVVGVPDATRAIRTGERVRVNGDLGYVEVVDAA